MALQTQGFQLQALPPLPQIPDNVGKIDVKAIYDRVNQALNTGQSLATDRSRQEAENAQLGAQRSTALAQQAVLPSQTEANIRQNVRSSALASPAIVAGEVNKTQAGLDADLAAEQLRRDNARFQATLTPAQRLVLASNGPAKASTGSTVLSPDGKTFQSTQSTTANVGGENVPISTSTETSPATPVLTPLPGINGTSLGTAVTTVGPDGKPTVHVAAAPLGALNNIVTGTNYQKIGERRDEQGNVKEIYQAFTTSAAGGQPKPVGAPVETLQGSGPPGTTPTQPTQPFISKDASKAIEDVQSEVQSLQGRKVELANIRQQADKFINESEAGRFIGPIAKFLGADAAQQFTGSVQNALSTALQPLRGTGRVSNTEFQQALSALPTIQDSAATIKQKLDYLDLFTDWRLAREDAIQNALGRGLNRYQAFQEAAAKTPIPEVPKFYPNQAASPAPAPAPAVAQPSNPSAASGSVPTITSQQQYDALPVGAQYLDSKGTPHVKGGPRG